MAQRLLTSGPVTSMSLPALALPPIATLSGRMIAGRYRVLGLLGQGGIGRVYLAEQRGLDRRVALKVIRPERRDDPVTAARFVREARAAGRIASPRVVRMYDCGRDERGDLYIAMEHLVGQSLLERTQRGPELGLLEATRIAAAVADGLAAAHAAGVLHRDLKPANVFLCDDGSVKVLDFGIAKLLDEQPADALTAEHRILGTPVYMSPEAARRRPLGPAADLYALGVLLFEMIAGEPPFKTGDASRTLRAHVTLPAPRLRDAAPWLIVPRALDELVASLLEKDPARRPHDAAEVARKLERIAMGLALDATVREQRARVAALAPPRIEFDDDGETTMVWSGSRVPVATELARACAATVHAASPEPQPARRSRLVALGPTQTAILASALGLIAFAAVFLLRVLI